MIPRRHNTGQLRPGTGRQEPGTEAIAPADRIVEVTTRVLPAPEHGGEQAKLERDRPGRKHRRAYHGELIRHWQQPLI